ncbi:uncharacterized protein [Panulirus ornatus]|uniref:uncharacterized protein n=1 Tax=Panulirus ornatus TaxID=150431 RepID=UPI003A86914F
MYSGTLTAALAVTAYEKPIDSLYDLADAHQDGYTIGTMKDTNYDATFKNAESGIYHEVWRLFNHEDSEQSLLPSQDKGFEMVLNHKYVLINAELNSRMKATQRGRQKFYMARETFLPQGYGIACSSGSPFKDIFSRILIRLTELGLVNKWANDEVDKVSQYIPSSSESGPTAISLQHLQIEEMGSHWILWTLILTFSSSVEAWSYTVKKSSDDGINYQDDMSYILVRVVLPHIPHHRKPLQPVSKDSNKACSSVKNMTGLTAGKTVNTSRRLVGIRGRSENTSEISILLKDASSISHMLEAVGKDKILDCDVLLAYDVRYSQQAVLRDLKLLHNPGQVSDSSSGL